MINYLTKGEPIIIEFLEGQIKWAAGKAALFNFEHKYGGDDPSNEEYHYYRGIVEGLAMALNYHYKEGHQS